MDKQLFVNVVIPSVMVQSYICYVTKPIVEDELLGCSKFSLSLMTVGRIKWLKDISQKTQQFKCSLPARREL